MWSRLSFRGPNRTGVRPAVSLSYEVREERWTAPLYDWHYLIGKGRFVDSAAPGGARPAYPRNVDDVATEPESLLRPQTPPTGRNGHSRGLIFDFDGTLVDSYPLIEQAFTQVMREHRLDDAARQLVRQSRGLPLPEQMKIVAPHMWEQLVATYRSVDSRLGHARMFRGLPTLLRKLRQRGSPR